MRIGGMGDVEKLASAVGKYSRRSRKPAAIHNHIEMESPRIVFLHYWGVLARRLILPKGERRHSIRKRSERESSSGLLLDHQDSHFRPHQVGLRTKTGSVSAFDDLEIKGYNSK
jgi:hypothetical protein